MPQHVIIDGNNVLYAMHAHAPEPAVGRVALVRAVERWAKRGRDKVTLVFDGGPPEKGKGETLESSRIFIRFSSPVIADDVIIRLAQTTPHPDATRVITDDNAVAKAARHYRCKHTGSVAFVEEIFARPAVPPRSATDEEDPAQTALSGAETTEDWLKLFGMAPPEQEDEAWLESPTLSAKAEAERLELEDLPEDVPPEGLENETTEDWLEMFGFDQED